MQSVYLDNAATLYPKSSTVLGAMEKAFYSCGNGGRSGHPLALSASETIYDCREELACLVGAEVQNTVLCSGATLALNMAIKGLARGEVLCSALEHNAALRPLYALAASGAIRLRFFTPSLVSKTKTVAAFKAALRPDTRLAVFTHASNVCGMCLPVKELCAIARERGVATVVDCAQTVGHIPVNINDLGADALCIAGHKGLGGPMGTGALVISENYKGEIATLIEGGTGVASREPFMPKELPERLEAGTANLTGIAGLAAACRELVMDTHREEELRQYLVKGLREIKGVTVYGAWSDVGYVPIVLFNVDSIPSDTVAAKLADKGIYLRGGLHCAPLAHSTLGSGKYGGVRASLSRHNTKKDCDLLLEAVADIAGKI